MLWFAITFFYTAVATASMYMTWREHTRYHHKGIAWTMLGMAFCLVWPLAIVVVGIAANRQSFAIRPTVRQSA